MHDCLTFSIGAISAIAMAVQHNFWNVGTILIDIKHFNRRIARRYFKACKIKQISLASAVHRSRRAGAGAGVLPYFAGAGAGAGVCSPPAKLRQHLFVLQTSIIDQRKTYSIEEKVNTAQYSLTPTYKL